MEQALLVDPDVNAAPAVIANVNFVRLCGPIIEVVDERLQFVHFTVKESVTRASSAVMPPPDTDTKLSPTGIFSAEK
jgi:hypothetical protein